jgi:hypothetical protein
MTAEDRRARRLAVTLAGLSVFALLMWAQALHLLAQR